jgi:thioredoxin 1
MSDPILKAISFTSGGILVDFWADWCAPCKKLSKDLHEVSTDHPEVTVFTVNIDENPRVAAHFGVMSVPALVAIRDGELLAVHGAVSKRRLSEIFEELS